MRVSFPPGLAYHDLMQMKHRSATISSLLVRANKLGAWKCRVAFAGTGFNALETGAAFRRAPDRRSSWWWQAEQAHCADR